MGRSRYKKIKIAGRTYNLHRHMMEQHLGRKLLPSEHVHHKNEDRFDNRLENLVVLSSHEHQAHHKTKYPKTKACEVCGTVFTPHPTKRKRAKTCSPPCARKLMTGRPPKKRAA